MQIQTLFCTETSFTRNLTRALLVLLPIAGLMFGIWIGNSQVTVSKVVDDSNKTTLPDTDDVVGGVPANDIPSTKDDAVSAQPDSTIPSKPVTSVPDKRPLAVASFEECEAVGYLIMESYPRQCRDGAGTLHVEAVQPIRTDPIATSECTMTNCHGPDVTCGMVSAAEPLVCDMMYQMGDFCRGYVSCGIVHGACKPVKEARHEMCVSCVKKCEDINDPIKAFECEDRCRAME